MPNWVETTIYFDGEEKDILKVLETIRGDKEHDEQSVFDFNKLIPMPECLQVESSSTSELALAYYTVKKFNRLPKTSWHKDMQEVIKRVEKDIKVSSEEILKFGKQLHDNIEAFGSKDWYDWCCRNWGTKWNACDCYLSATTLCFQTAWAWPEPVMCKLAVLCAKHNVSFDGEWADEDMGHNTGHFYCDGISGELSYDYYPDCSNEAYAAYVNCQGESDCIGTDVDGNSFRYECESCPNREECGN